MTRPDISAIRQRPTAVEIADLCEATKAVPEMNMIARRMAFYIEALEGVVREYGFRHVKFCPRHPDSVGNQTPEVVCRCGLIARLAELGLEK